MTVFAIVEGGVVENIAVAQAKAILEALLPNKEIIEESKETGLAWVGSEMINGKFKPPKPFSSWLFDSDKFAWQAPKAKPEDTDGQGSYWNEAILDWVTFDLPRVEPTSEPAE